MIKKIKLIFRKKISNLRLAIQIKKLSRLNSKPLYVEFTGVPGVGKSTIYKKLISDNNNLIKASDFTRKFTLKEREKNMIREDLFYNNILNNQIFTISQGKYPAIDKLTMLNTFKRILIEDKVISTNNKNITIVDDEGFFKYFSYHINRIYSLTEERNELFEKIINRVIIYCYSTPERITSQVLKRYQETGGLIVPFRNKSEEELKDIIKERLDKEEHFIHLMKEIKMPVLLIDTADNLEENIKKINDFIKNQQQ